MATATETDQNTIIVDLPAPHLDSSTVNCFREGMEPVLSDAEQVLLNLEELNFVDSSGLGALLHCLRQQDRKGGQFKIYGLNKQVRLLFELVRMHHIFDIFNSREEALKSFKLPDQMTIVLPRATNEKLRAPKP